MIRKGFGCAAILLTMALVGCGGSEYRFGNGRTLPNLSGQWNFSATSIDKSQQYQGTANFAQSNGGVQGTVSNLFTYCAASATLGGALTPYNTTFDATSVYSYSVDIVLQENVPTGSSAQAIELLGTASADGTHMSGTYKAYPGSCTTGEDGTWQANK